MDASETDDESLVGEACHIAAHSDSGPRAQPSLPPEQRDKYRNLILLCNVHHKQVDDQSQAYSIDRLLDLKRQHEDWVRTQLGVDLKKQRDEELYASYVQEWAERIDLDNWLSWTSHIFSADQPSLPVDSLEALENVRPWLLSRVWPRRCIDLERALNNFRVVTQDFCSVFRRHAETQGDFLWTKKFYRMDRWDEARHTKLSDQYDHHVGLVEDLGLELTRAANYVCQAVREELLPSYRLREGVALIQAGPFEDFSYKTYRIEYKREEQEERLYPGLSSFETVRFDRAFYFGRKPG